MFFLRCAFWLSVVYASMSWPTNAFQMPGLGAHAIDLSRLQTEGFATTAVAGITDLCSRHRAECIAEAARLTSLVAAANTPEPAAERVTFKTVSFKTAEPRVAPTRSPNSHPRRLARDAKLRVSP